MLPIPRTPFKRYIQRMIELYRLRDDEEADQLEAWFKEMVAAYRAIPLTREDAVNRFGPTVTLPVIVDEGRTIHGRDALKAHMQETERTIERWRRFQSDSCYVRDDGKGTC